MAKKKILLLPGDGIGPEIVAQAQAVLQMLAEELLDVELLHGLIGGAAVDVSGDPFPAETLQLAQQADAILLGSVGGPDYDHLEKAKRPETGLLRLRAALDLFANLRPAILYPALAQASSLRPNLVADLDILIVRELTGGIYFGEPRGISQNAGQRRGYNTMAYSESEIERIAHVAFQAAAQRSGRLCSVDKANVLEVSALWREVVSSLSAQYPQVELSHMYVDNAAMQLVRSPKQFDVIVTGNMFGDILSDIAAMLTGSIGMLPSASLNGQQCGMYEPIHGSAPDISGKNIANPLATILSVAMMLKYSLGEPQLAVLVEQAVRATVDAGIRTQDIASDTDSAVGTREMGQQVLNHLRALL